MIDIRLIGPPRIIDEDGAIQQLRGQKPWALLARILLADRPLSRRELSSELFPDANDPLASLRWCLAELRRALGDAAILTGDPVRPDLPSHFRVDVLTLDEDVSLDIGAGALLGEIEPSWSPQFDMWLLVAREHVAGRVAAALHQRVVTALMRGRSDEAVPYAELAARRSPLDERAQILLVKSLVAWGQDQSALEHIARVEATFRSELGREPSPALRSAARRAVADLPLGVPLETQVRTLLEAGRDALSAGAADAGVECLRNAVAGAESGTDERLEALALFELGTALIHSVRSFDDEGCIILARSTAIAERVGDSSVAARSLCERAYADTLVGRRHDAAHLLARAHTLVATDVALEAAVTGYQAFNLGDWGRFDEALEQFDTALEVARRANDRSRQAWVLGVGAWVALRAGNSAHADDWARRSAALSRDLRWSSFSPFPALVLAEVGLTVGTDTPTRADLERTFALSCQLRDPCWEGGAARVLALHHAAIGDLHAAMRWITDARARSTRATDTWAAMTGEILLTEATLRQQADDRHAAEAAAREAVAHAARTRLDDTLGRALALVH